MDITDDLEEDKHLSNDLKSLQMALTQSEQFPFYSSTDTSFVDPPLKTREHYAQLLQLNREYQETLLLCIKQIEAAKLRNEELQKKVRTMMGHSGKRRAVTKRAAGGPYFCDATNESPPLNPDALRKVEKEQKAPLHFKYRKWTKNERTNLALGVERQNKRALYNHLLEQYMTCSSAEGKMHQEIAKAVSDQVNSIPNEEFRHETKDIDWESISKNFVVTRSAVDCKLQWLNNDYPYLNDASWSKAEDKKLLELAKKYDARDWELIAQELGTHRIAFQCFKRYQRSLNTAMVKGKWTAQEDNELKEAIKQYGVKNWQQVANSLNGRTGQQCLHRWQKTLRPNIKRGRWTADEDKLLTLAVKAYGSSKWIKVQQRVPGRTDVQCRERWVNILNPNLNVGAWSQEEDRKLDEAVRNLGLGKWSQVAAILAPRTDNQCWRRWKALHQDELDDYRQTILKKRIGLVNNFVGREKERPSLTPDDFDMNVDNARAMHASYSKKVDGEKEEEEEVLLTDNAIAAHFVDNVLEPLPLSFAQKQYPQQFDPEGELPAALPLLLPQPDTMDALQKLCDAITNFNIAKQIDPLAEEEESRLVNTKEYVLLGGIFNSLFLCPMLVHSQRYYSELADDTDLDEVSLPDDLTL